MAFPSTARDVSYTALQRVPSANLNNIQDAIIDLWGYRDAVQQWISTFDATTSQPHWHFTSATDYLIRNVAASGGTAVLLLQLGLPAGVVLEAVRVKVFVPTASGGSLSFTLQYVDVEWDAAATAPSATALDSASSGASTNAWEIVDLDNAGGGLGHTVTDQQRIKVEVTGPGAGFRIAGVRVELGDLP